MQESYAVSSIPTSGQLGITRQRDQRRRDLLQAAIMALDVSDPRREACQSVDSLSSAFLAAWPSLTRGWALSDREFREVITTYFGRQSPCTRELAGLPIQGTGRGGPRICDSHGRQLCLAALPGNGFRRRHDALVGVVPQRLPRRAPGQHGASPLFMHVLPQDMALLTVNMGRGDGTREMLFDGKTFSASGPTYAEQYRLNGAVAEPSQLVGAYENTARNLDRQHYGVVAPDFCPVLTALRTFPPVCGLGCLSGCAHAAEGCVHTLLCAVGRRSLVGRWGRARRRRPQASSPRASAVGGALSLRASTLVCASTD